MRRRVLVVDSRDRDVRAHPSPARYDWPLPDPLFGVTQMRLVNADLPRTHRLVSTGKNTLNIHESPALLDAGDTSNGGLDVSITPGDYANCAEFVAELQARLNATPTIASITAAHDPRRDAFELVSDLGPSQATPLGLGISFGHAGLARIMGFDPSVDLTTASARVVGMPAPNVVEVQGPLNFDASRLNNRRVVVTFEDPLQAPVTARVASTAVSSSGNVITITLFTAISQQMPARLHHGILVAPFRKDWRKDPRHIALRIDECEGSASAYASPAQGMQGALAVLEPAELTGSGDVARWRPSHRLGGPGHHGSAGTAVLDPPAGVLRRLRVSLVDSTGALYDTQNQDHRLEIEVTYGGAGARS
jgi:hypothetical protein